MNNFTHIGTIIVYAHTVAITTQKFTLQSTELTDDLFLLISSVMLVTYFPDCDNHFEENKTQ